MCLMSTLLTYSAPGLDPLPRFLLMWVLAVLVQDLNPAANERARSIPIALWSILFWDLGARGEWYSMSDR